MKKILTYIWLWISAKVAGTTVEYERKIRTMKTEDWY